MSAEKKTTSPPIRSNHFANCGDNYLDAMSKVMINAVNSEEYAEASAPC